MAEKLTKQLYDKMFLAYQEKQTAHHVFESLKKDGEDVSKYRIRKAIQEGDPKLGLKSIEARFAQINKEATKQEDYDAIRFRSELVRMCRALYVQMAQKITRLTPRDWDALDVDKFINCFEKISRVMGSLGFNLAEMSATPEKKDPFSDWTVEEKADLIFKGIYPRRLDNVDLN